MSAIPYLAFCLAGLLLAAVLVRRADRQARLEAEAILDREIDFVVRDIRRQLAEKPLPRASFRGIEFPPIQNTRKDFSK
jgi:hypothetical protein